MLMFSADELFLNDAVYFNLVDRLSYQPRKCFNHRLFDFWQFRSPPARSTGPSLCLPPRATKAQPVQARQREVPRTAWPLDATPSLATRTALWAPVGRPIP